MGSVSDVFMELKDGLEPTVLSWKSVYGIVVLLLFVIGVALCFRSVGYAAFLLGTFAFLQIGHVVACSTQVGADLPFLQALFRYDVFAALAQLCVGTGLSDALLWLQAYLNFAVGTAVGLVYDWIRILVLLFGRAYDGLRSI